MHGFIWDNDGIALEEWKNGYTYEGDYMSNKAITYTTKYMLKIHKQDKLYVPKIMCSAGIGKKWTEGIGAKRAKYKSSDRFSGYSSRICRRKRQQTNEQSSERK